MGGHLALPHLLSCYPPPALSSRFFGITDPSGAPVLSPPAADAAQQAQRGGALQAAVGDVVLLSLHVVSALPVDLPLSSVVLTLGLLQQLTGGAGRQCRGLAACWRVPRVADRCTALF